jgi:aminomethyltransferase
MAPATTRKTALHDRHLALGARMMAFAGYDMPVQYSGIVDEHTAVRTAAGMFDVSHMGEFRVRGPKAFDLIQGLVTNDVSKMYDGRAMYTVMCYPDGGIVDDLIVYRLAEDDYMMVVNAANIEKDLDWIELHNGVGADIEDVSDHVALIAVQGPRATDIVQGLTDLPVSDIKFYHFLSAPSGAFFGCDHAILSGTGYTGEPGLEIYCDPDRAGAVWDAILEAGRDKGLVPAGLGARDTLRLEAGFCLYGNDITNETNPIEAGQSWITKPDKGDFIGRDSIVQVKSDGPARKLVAFKMVDRGIPRQGYELADPAGAVVGAVTSGSQSPVLGCGIGLGYVTNRPEFTAPGSDIRVVVRSRSLKATVAKPPLHKTG